MHILHVSTAGGVAFAGDLDAHMTTVDSTIIALDKAPGQLRVVYLTDQSRAGAAASAATAGSSGCGYCLT